MTRGHPAKPSAEDSKLRQTDFSQKVLTVNDVVIYCRRIPTWDIAVKEERRYFAGSLPLATVEAYKPGFPLRFTVTVADHSRGNGKKKFETEAEVHAFLAGILQTKPVP